MNCCNHNKMPRPVRGNAFNVAVTVVARRIDGTVIDDFALTSEAVLNITHGTSSTEKEYTIIDQNVAVIHFDGTDDAGIYGVEFTGEWNGEPWRFAVPVVFQVVELTTQGWLPQDGIIYEPTYEVDAEIVIAGGGGGAVFLEADFVQIGSPLVPKFSFNDIKNALDAGQAVFIKWVLDSGSGMVNVNYLLVIQLAIDETPGDEAYSAVATDGSNTHSFSATDPDEPMTDESL